VVLGDRRGNVSVVVVTYNGRDLVGACLQSLANQTHPPREILVVDNGSTDGTSDWIRFAHPSVRVIQLVENWGFAGGANVGIQEATGEFIAFLNTDAIARPEWLEEMLDVMRTRPDVGMVASQMLRAHDPSQVDSSGICLDRAGMAWDRQGGTVSPPDDELAEVFGPCAGAALYRRTLFADVGRFDERFFMYLEDVDLAWRARFAGWRCVYAPSARVLHQHSATSGEHSPFKRYHLTRNKLWLVAKNYPLPDLCLYLPVILALELGTVLASFLPGRGKGASSLMAAGIRGRLDGIAGLRAMVASRSQIQRARRVPGWRVGSLMEPPTWPWTYRQRLAHLNERRVGATD
jgi:hypothetical protein